MKAPMWTVETIRHDPETGGYAVTVELTVPHEVYDGHFPSRSVVPGVVSLDIAEGIASRIAGRRMRMVGIKQCKYLKMLLPENREDRTLTLHVKLSADMTAADMTGRNAAGELYVKLKGEMTWDD